MIVLLVRLRYVSPVISSRLPDAAYQEVVIATDCPPQQWLKQAYSACSVPGLYNLALLGPSMCISLVGSGERETGRHFSWFERHSEYHFCTFARAAEEPV